MNVQQKKFQNTTIRYLELAKRDLLLNTKDVLGVLHITERPEGSVLAESCLDLTSAISEASRNNTDFAKWLNETFAGYNPEALAHLSCDHEWNFD